MNYSTKLRIQKNEIKKCSVSNCFKGRYGLSSYCKNHSRKQYLYGSPLGSGVFKHDYQEELKEAKAFLKKYAEHPAVKAAIGFFNERLEDASKGFHGIGKDEYKTLHAEGITGQQCVEVFLTVWLYSSRNPHRLPDDIRLTYALATHIFGIKRKKTWKASVKKEVGEELRRVLGVFALNSIRAIEALKAQRFIQKDAISTEFYIEGIS